jgi:hypothetical protein
MKRPILIRPEAEADIEEAYRWYEEKLGGLSWPPRPERMEVPPLAIGSEAHRGELVSVVRFQGRPLILDYA